MQLVVNTKDDNPKAHKAPLTTCFPNCLIAITGISGYIASYRLVRSPRSRDSPFVGSPTLSTATRSKVSPLPNFLHECVIVDDLASEDQWSAALKDVDGIVGRESSLGVCVKEVCGNMCVR